jgi:hypothetical protein
MKAMKDEIGMLPGVISATQPLRSASGRLDAEKIRVLFGFTETEIAAFLNTIPQLIQRAPDALGFQAGLKPFEKISRLLVLNNDPGNFRSWLQRSNDEFSGLSPLDIIRRKGPSLVADLVEDILVNRGG